MTYPNSRHTPQRAAYRTPPRGNQLPSNPLIERLIKPQIVANWSLDDEGKVVCLWESPVVTQSLKA